MKYQYNLKKKIHKKTLLTALYIIGSILVLGFLLYVCSRFIPYPELEDFKNRPWSTRVYDSNGELIQILPLSEGLRREFVPLNEMSSELITVFIAAEDNRFFYHQGVDLVAVLRALFQNIAQGRKVSGASTITMQLARMISPSLKRNWLAKIRDVCNAYRLEARLSKETILELYLNNLPFGARSEGVASAARTYFGLSLSDLSSEHLYCLAVIPRRPSAYNPFDYSESCAEAAIRLYTSLHDDNSVFERIRFVAHTARPYEYPFFMPHYVRYISAQYADKNGRLPYEVQLSARLDVHSYAQGLVHQALSGAEQSRITNAAVLAIDNRSGEIITWIGSNSWFDNENGGQIDGVLTTHQPGSSMKPFLYALALEYKHSDGQPFFSPAQALPDIPMEFGSDERYIPLNFNNRFNGPVRFRVALASSLNVPAVYILNEIGVSSYLECLYSLGFNSLRENGLKADLGLALGAAEVSLAELVRAFSVFPRDGIYIPFSHFKKDRMHEKTATRVFDSDTARLICSFLSDKSARVTGFGYAQTFETSFPALFKTGTSNQYQNITAVGATLDYTVGVWMGNFSGNTVVGKTGSSLPAWIARNVLEYLEEKNDSKNTEFPEPENWIKQRICITSGMAIGKNCPHSVYEYTKKDVIHPSCTWHDERDGVMTVVYPALYQQWFHAGRQNGVLSYNESPLIILTPQKDAHFYYDVSNKNRQAIPFEVTGGQGDILSVVYDGEEFCMVDRPFVFSLPVERGKHEVQIVCGTEIDTISYIVE